jgi:PTH1 family peptidyl-tRNA hydrolase
MGPGSPGIECQFTPHNLGFLTIDRITNDWREVKSPVSAPTAGEIAATGFAGKPRQPSRPERLSVRELAVKRRIRPETDHIMIYKRTGFAAGHRSAYASGQFGGSQWHEVGHQGVGHPGVLRIRLGIAPTAKLRMAKVNTEAIPGSRN